MKQARITFHGLNRLLCWMADKSNLKCVKNQMLLMPSMLPNTNQTPSKHCNATYLMAFRFFSTTLLMLKSVITPRDAFSGFSNDSIVTIALMVALAEGLEHVGALEYLPELVLGRSKKEWLGQVRAGIDW